MSAESGVVTGASYVAVPPLSNPTVVASSPLASFPTDGSTFAVLTSGDALLADDANSAPNSGVNAGGTNVRGDTDFDVTVLRVDLSVPQDRNCLSIDFRFLSEEFPEYVGQAFNDGFVAELDTTSWTTSGSSITAPNNFAFDPSGNVISINGSGVADMSASEAAGTTYDGATALLRASSPLNPGAHSLYLSIFDQGDSVYDSAVFVDRLSLGTTSTGGCQPGAQLPPPTVSKTADDATSAPGGQIGYEITISNPNDTAVSLESIVDTLPDGFSYLAGSTGGVTSADPNQDGPLLTWEGPIDVPAEGSVSLRFDVTVASEPGEYPNEALATADGFTIESTGPTAPVTVEGFCQPVSLSGTVGGDKLVGTSGSDRIRALGGRDTVDALAGADEACAGDGGDYVYGRGGADRLLGEAGNDRLYGGDQADELDGGPGHDAFIPGRGTDVILAQDGTIDCIQRRSGDEVHRDPIDLVNPRNGCAPGFWL